MECKYSNSGHIYVKFIHAHWIALELLTNNDGLNAYRLFLIKLAGLIRQFNATTDRSFGHAIILKYDPTVTNNYADFSCCNWNKTHSIKGEIIPGKEGSQQFNNFLPAQNTNQPDVPIAMSSF